MLYTTWKQLHLQRTQVTLYFLGSFIMAREQQFCPEHCDESGLTVNATFCGFRHCCKFENGSLGCCLDSDLATDDLQAGYNCDLFQMWAPRCVIGRRTESKTSCVCVCCSWEIVLIVCVPLASLSLISFFFMLFLFLCKDSKPSREFFKT